MLPRTILTNCDLVTIINNLYPRNEATNCCLVEVNRPAPIDRMTCSQKLPRVVIVMGYAHGPFGAMRRLRLLSRTLRVLFIRDMQGA